MTEVPDNVLFRHMTPEQKAIVLMWYAMRLPTIEWCYDPHIQGEVEWHLEDDPHHEVLKVLRAEPDNQDKGYLDCYYRLKSP